MGRTQKTKDHGDIKKMSEAKGKKLFVQKYAQCHSYEAGGGSKQGPALHGFIGASAGTNANFGYSDAIKDSGIVWDAGTMMVFAGLKKKADRKNLVAFLTSNCSK